MYLMLLQRLLQLLEEILAVVLSLQSAVNASQFGAPAFAWKRVNARNLLNHSLDSAKVEPAFSAAFPKRMAAAEILVDLSPSLNLSLSHSLSPILPIRLLSVDLKLTIPKIQT